MSVFPKRWDQEPSIEKKCFAIIRWSTYSPGDGDIALLRLVFRNIPV